MIKLYYPATLDKEAKEARLHRWPFVYLHGEAEGSECASNSPDIFVSSTKLEDVDDGITECQLYRNGKFTKVDAYIWTIQCKVVFRNHVFTPVNPHREGLVVLAANDADQLFAYSNYERQSTH